MSDNNGDGLGPVWQPGDAQPAWAAELRRDFNSAEIGLRPKIWCSACSKSDKKACGGESGGVKHERAKCGDCGQNITRAHLHLSYVGHAHATERLLDTDPRWTWRPMARDVNPDVLIAAIGTGDLAIVNAVINAAPPALTEMVIETGRGPVTERGMWIEVIVHDENGEEVITPGFGDAVEKMWGPNAMKEIIGDGIRNATMRRGLALNLWKKEDKDRHKQEKRGMTSVGELFDEAGEENQDQPQRGNGRRKPQREAPADTGKAAGINPEAQAAADLAKTLAGKPATLDELQAEFVKARGKQLMGLHCADPWDRSATVKVFEVFAKARKTLEAAAKG